MKKIIFLTLFMFHLQAGTPELFPFVSQQVFQQVEGIMPELKNYPAFEYPNQDHDILFSYFPNNKVLIFGYGSLINKSSLGGNNNASGKPTVKQAAVDSVEPVIAFGLKRLFNYENQKGSSSPEFPNEKAYLNVAYSPEPSAVVNGVVFEADREDLNNLVQRELGYDLVPVLFISWNDVLSQNSSPNIQVAYTFMASSEPRNGIVYTNNNLSPIRNYLLKIEEAVKDYDPMFFQVWKDTTYLGDGKTRIHD